MFGFLYQSHAILIVKFYHFLGRVLVFTNNSAIAYRVFGQPSFTSNIAGSGSTGFVAPVQISVSPNGLLVLISDQGLNRILVFANDPSIIFLPRAVQVIGQSSFSGTSANAGFGSPVASGFNLPYAMAWSSSSKVEMSFFFFLSLF